ncbi:MAG TPA: fluoride efflux transporter CrcB [Candidatus Tidjanibacter gallistercoris]|nr:fluoride efflux transporter CrcB [Candidatus Tidjanibacter gallistercoris]
MLKEVLLVGAGGFAGSALRWAVSAAIASWAVSCGFPAGTFAVNAAGSFIIGLAGALLPPGGWQLFAMTGFCGGFTTFSAFSLEVLRMLRAGQGGTAAVYIAASVAVCLLFAGLGLWLGEKIPR